MGRKVLVYGAGVIGSVYAVRFARAGFDVSVVARGDRLEAIRKDGLRIRHVFLGEEERADVKLLERLDAEAYDLVLVTVRAGQIMSALADVNQCGEAGTVIAIGNNIQAHAEQAALVGPGRFVLGFGSFGGYRDGGVIAYLDGRTREKPSLEHGNSTTLGALSTESASALERAKEAFAKAGLRTVTSPDMVAWLQCHAALVFPLAGAIYAAGGEQDRTCRTRDALVLGVRACHELFRALRKLGIRLEPAALKTLLRMPEPLIVRMMGLRFAGESARVAMFGHANAPRGRGEIAEQASLLDSLARKAGLPLPSWERLLPYFDPQSGVPPIGDGSRTLRLRIW
jgi:2-dehydropantoate 2-reductase